MTHDSASPPLISRAEKLAALAALEAAYARGVEYVSYGGDQIKYVPSDEIRRRIDDLRAELGLPGRPRFRPRPRRLVMRVR